MKNLRTFALLAALAITSAACHSSKNVASTKSKKSKDPVAAGKAKLEGTNLDRFVSELKATSNEYVEALRTPDGVTVTFEPQITFESSSDQLEGNGKEVLSNTSRVLSKYAFEEIFVEGHADSSGIALKNKDLSVARAKTVAVYFKSNGVKTERLAIAGYGASKPVVSNATPEGRKRNRRVVIKLKANEKQFADDNASISVSANK